MTSPGQAITVSLSRSPSTSAAWPGLTICHEDLSDAEGSAAIDLHQLLLGLPASDALPQSLNGLVEMVPRVPRPTTLPATRSSLRRATDPSRLMAVPLGGSPPESYRRVGGEMPAASWSEQ